MRPLVLLVVGVEVLELFMYHFVPDRCAFGRYEVLLVARIDSFREANGHVGLRTAAIARRARYCSTAQRLGHGLCAIACLVSLRQRL